MNGSEKMPPIGNLAGLGGIHEKMRKGELSALGTQGLRKEARRLGLKPAGSDQGIIAQIIAMEASQQPAVAVAELEADPVEEPGLQEREEGEPPVTSNAELVLETNDRVTKKETPDEVLERINARATDDLKNQAKENQIKNYARRVSEGDLPFSDEGRQFLEDNKPEIYALANKYIEVRTALGGRTTTANPFPLPKIAREIVAAPVEDPIVKIEAPIESAKVEAPVFAQWDHKEKRIHLESGAQMPAASVELENKPVAKIETISEPETFQLKTNPEGLPKRTGEVLKEESKSEPVVEASKPIAPVKEATKVEPEHVLQQKVSPEVKPTFEARGAIPKLDGLVEFNLGKLGIIDGLDDATTRELKLGKLRDLAPEFFSLSTAQQLYTLEKLGQKKSHDLDMMAGELQKADKRGFLKRVFDKGYMRREEVKKMKEGGAESYAEDLQGISRSTLDRGKQIEMTSEGMMIKFMDVETEDMAYAKVLREFNLAATKLAEIPYNSTMKDLTVMETLQKRKYEKAKKVYDEMRRKVVAFEGKAVVEGEMKAKLQKLSDVDDDVRFNQSLTYNTDATNAVAGFIRDWKLGDKVAYAGAGIAARGLAKYALGFGGGALAAGIIGGARGWIGKQQEFQKLADQKRSGEEVNEKGVKEVINASDFAESINKRVKEIERLPDGPKKDSLIRRLQNRVTLARERDSLGLVNFGKADKRVFGARDAFYNSLKASNRVLFENDAEMKAQAADVATRMQERLFKDEEKDSERSKAKWRAFYKGALTGGVFFIGAFEARDLIFHDGVATKEAINGIAKASKEVLGATKEFAGNVYAAHDAMLEQSGIKEVARDVTLGAREVGERVLQGTKEAAGTSAKPPLASNWNKPDFHKLAVTPESGPNASGDTGGDKSISGISPDGAPKLEQTFAMVGGRGAIGAIDDLQEKVAAQYGANIPESLKAFMAAKPEKLAQEWGFYRPGEDAESATILKGARFGLNTNGQIVFQSHEGQIVKLSGAEKFDGKFFDAGHKDAAAALAQEKEAVFGGRAVGDLSDQPAGLGASFNTVGGSLPETGIEGGTSGSSPNSLVGGPEGSAASSGIQPEGLALNTPEIKGTILAKYDDFGRVTRMEWSPQAKIDEVIRFQRTPDKFLVENLKGTGLTYETRSFAVGELRKNQIAEDCIKYLRLRNMLRSGGFAPNSPEANYISGQMRLVGASIESKIGSSFRPIQEDGVLTGLKNMGPVQVAPLENTAPASGAKPGFEFKPVKAIDETLEVATKADHELAYGTDFKDKDLTGHMEFLKDTNGKVSQIVYEGVESPFDQNWKEYMKPDWKEGTTAETRKAIQKAVRDLIRTQVIMDRGGLGQNFSEGQEILAKHVAYVSEKFAKYMDMEKFRAALSQKS